MNPLYSGIIIWSKNLAKTIFRGHDKVGNIVKNKNVGMYYGIEECLHDRKFNF